MLIMKSTVFLFQNEKFCYETKNNFDESRNTLFAIASIFKAVLTTKAFSTTHI